MSVRKSYVSELKYNDGSDENCSVTTTLSILHLVCMSKTAITRLLAVISMLIVVPLGLLSKKYTGFADEWIHHNAGDIFYQIFWCLFIFFFIPTRSAANRIPILVFFLGCIVEFTQMWHTPELEWIRSYFWGRLLLGASFDWREFPTYALGSIIGWLWLLSIGKYTKQP